MRYAFCRGVVPPGQEDSNVSMNRLEISMKQNEISPEGSNVSMNRLQQMLSEFLT